MSAAAAGYSAHQRRIASLLTRVQQALDAHATKAAARPLDWGFAGDLGAFESQLHSLLAMLGALTPEEHERYGF